MLNKNIGGGVGEEEGGKLSISAIIHMKPETGWINCNTVQLPDCVIKLQPVWLKCRRHFCSEVKLRAGDDKQTLWKCQN